MTLTEFLLARIAEDEAEARAAVIPAHDGYKSHPELARWQYVPDGEVEYVQTPEMLAHKYADPIYVTCDGEGLVPAVDERVGPHIARHDPARVLAECEAKRRIVEREGQRLREQWRRLSDEHRQSFEQWFRKPYGETLRDLATVYADHPDYDEAWRP